MRSDVKYYLWTPRMRFVLLFIQKNLLFQTLKGPQQTKVPGPSVGDVRVGCLLCLRRLLSSGCPILKGSVVENG